MRKEKIKMIEIACARCQKRFVPYRKHNIFCSYSCKRNLQGRPKAKIVSVCKECGKQFSPEAKGPHQKFCTRKCYEQDYAKNNRPRLRKNAQRHYRATFLAGMKVQPWANLLRKRAKIAKMENIPFELTPEWAISRWTGYCEATKLPFATPEERCSSQNKNFSPSIDKIIPALGYTQENCRFVLWVINKWKGTGTDEEMYRLAEALIAQRKLLIAPIN